MRRRLRRRLGPEQLGVLAATGMLAGALLAWAVVTPAYRGPDEPQHVSTALRLATGGGYPEPGTPRIDAGVRGTFAPLGFPGMGDRAVLAQRIAPPSDPVPSTGERRAAAGDYPDAGLIDQMTQHPPAYYGYLAALIKVFGLDDAGANTLVLLSRLASLVLLLPIPWLIAATIGRLGLPAHVRLLGAFVPAAWMQFAHIGAVVNNGTLLALAASAYLYCLVRVVTGDRSVRTALGGGVALGVALLTKGFALSLLPLAPFAYVVANRAARVSARAVVAFAVPSALGLAWWIRNVVVFGTVQPSGEEVFPQVGAGRSLLDWPARFLNDLSASMWVNLGWLETPLAPAVLHVAVSLAALGLAAYGTYRLRGRPAVVALLHAAWLLPLAVFAVGSARIWQADGVIRGAQGRYLHAAIVPITVLLVVAAARWPLLARLAPLGAVVSIAGGVVFGLRHFWAPSTFGTATVLWPAGDAVLVAAAVLLGASTAIAAVVVTRRDGYA